VSSSSAAGDVKRTDSWDWDGEATSEGVKKANSWDWNGETSWNGDDVDVDAMLEEVKLPSELLSLVLGKEVEEPLPFGQLDSEYHEVGKVKPSSVIW
jgi:hypothetical protein